MRQTLIALLAIIAIAFPAFGQDGSKMGLNGGRSVINAVVQKEIRSMRAMGRKLHPGAGCNLLARDLVEILAVGENEVTVRRVRRLASVTINLKVWQYMPKSFSRSETCPINAEVNVPKRYLDALVKSFEAHKANEDLKKGEKG